MATTAIPNLVTMVVDPSPSSLSTPPSSILLKDSLGPYPRQRHDSAVASSSTSTSTSSGSRSHSAERSSRRIRFAPLPAPRREEQLPDSLLFPDDSDSDQPASGSLALTASASPPAVEPPPSPRLLPFIHSDDINAKSKSLSWGQKLLRPLLPSRKSPSPPTPTTAAAADTSLLRRIASHDSIKDASVQQLQYKGGAPLGRSMSTGTSFRSSKETERATTYRDGAPLHPVLSETTHPKPRIGQRMLNGRVYGRRSDASFISGVNDSYEPEFVEWGYGGMGSVNNSHDASTSAHGPDWAKVQSRGNVVVGNVSREGAEDPDDGGGMGWVRRRREQRERERREMEEREKASATDVANAVAQDEKQQQPHQQEYQKSTTLPEIAVSPPSDTPSRKASSENTLEEEHLCEAISIPAPHHHHHHRQKDLSPAPLSRDNSASIVPARSCLSPPPNRDEGDLSSGSSSTSVSSVDDDSDEDDDEDENDDTERDSDDSDDDAQGRLTSKGAGVEKISRHKE